MKCTNGLRSGLGRVNLTRCVPEEAVGLPAQYGHISSFFKLHP